MDNERVREICLGLPHVAESVAWGHHLLFWVGDKAIGGKMFAVTDLDGTGDGVLSFHCGADRFHELVEMDGVIPAPYSARNFWVLVQRWDAMRARQYEEELRLAHGLIYDKLPKRTKTVLAMPEKERAAIVRERRKLLAAKEAKKQGGGAA
jgi:predicted DNA-binding protein (MmcQ/YjbR family)